MTKSNSTYSSITPATSLCIPSSKTISVQIDRRCSRSGARATHSFCLRAPKPSSATTRAPKYVSTTPDILRLRRTLGKLPTQFATSWVASCPDKPWQPIKAATLTLPSDTLAKLEALGTKSEQKPKEEI